MGIFTTDRKFIFALALALLLHCNTHAADDFSTLQTEYAPLGNLIVTQFISAPFPHPARASGHKYDGQFYSAPEHYSNSEVALFIPKNFRATDKIDFVVHFHGWRHTVASTLPEYKLVEQFSASGKNAILIVPQGPYNAPDSFDGKLEDTNGFKIFMTEAMEKLRAHNVFTNAEIGNIILSGHSGGYHVMAAILDHGGLPEKIREVWIFDALYGNVENFVAWQKNQNGRLLDIYTDHGGTKENSVDLMANYRTNDVSFFASEDTNAVPENLRTNRIVFLHTDMAHDDTVGKRGTFEEFLKTSCLDKKLLTSQIFNANEWPEFQIIPPITNADPSVLHQISIRVPTKLEVARTADILSVTISTNSFEPTNLMVGTNMITGVKSDWFIYPVDKPRPAESGHGYSSGLDFHLGTSYWNSQRDGIPLADKKYIVEIDLAVFETDIPPQHFWQTQSKNYKILWRRTLKQTVE